MRSEAVSSPWTGKALLPVLTVALGALMLAVVASPARADTFEVTNTNDSGAGSLRQAITGANSNTEADTIEIGATGTVVLESALPELTTDMEIAGPGADQLTVKRSEALGTPEFSIFGVGEKYDGTELKWATVTISGLTITNGVATDWDGGGIYNGGSLMLTDSVVTGNSSVGEFGGGISNVNTLTVKRSTVSNNTARIGGGIENGSEGMLTVENSTVSGNSSTGDGGGLWNGIDGTVTIKGSTFSGNDADWGGGINNSHGTLRVKGSTFSDNDADWGGGIDNGVEDMLTVEDSTFLRNAAGYNGGGIHNRGTLTVNDSTFSGNDAVAQNGGGIDNGGTLAVEGSTFSGNSADTGGGIESYTDDVTSSEPEPEERTTIRNSTFSGNSADIGGGVYNHGGLTVMENTTITDNTAPENSGSGIASFGGNDWTRTEVSSSIITANRDPEGNSGSDVGLDFNRFNSFESGGYNLIGGGEATVAFGAEGDQTGVSAWQAFGTGTPQLADNGGPTQTIALQAGSRAIDRIPSGTNGCGEAIQTDQRGVARIAVDWGGDGTCDTGAFELEVGSEPPPDKDGDGVPNPADACPDQPANTANGCPPPDRTVPTGSVKINNGAQTTRSLNVRLALSARDNRGGSGVSQVCVSNAQTCAKWRPYSTGMAWTLLKGKAGTRTVYVRFKDRAGNVSTLYRDTIRYAPPRR